LDELMDCARCFAPAVEVITFGIGDHEFELDLCADHLERLLAGASPQEERGAAVGEVDMSGAASTVRGPTSSRGSYLG
jgi:hypothetical protein